MNASDIESGTRGRWPTIWPADSFRALPTALTVLAIFGVSAVTLVAGVLYLLDSGSLRAGARAASVPIVPAIVLQLILEALIVAIIVAALPRLSKFSLGELGFRPLRPWQIGVALLGAIAMIVVVEGGATLVQSLTHTDHEQQVVAMFKAIRDPAQVWFFALFAAVLAPVAEEIIFRVFVFNIGLRYAGFWTGAAVSGLLFGAAHADAFVLVPLMLGGMILCAVYYRTHNAFASMITHGIFNGVTVVAVLFAPQLAK